MTHLSFEPDSVTWPDTGASAERDVFGNDLHVCALSIMGARRQGVDVQTRVASIFTYHDGFQLERWFYPDDGAAWDRIFTD